MIPVPASQTAPTITGTVQVGDILTASPGVWFSVAQPVTYAYVWHRVPTTIPISEVTSGGGGIATVGSNSLNYTPVVADVGHMLAVRVVATNAGGSDTAASGLVGPVVSAPPVGHAPVNVDAPTIVGTPVVGDLLTAEPGTWD